VRRAAQSFDALVSTSATLVRQVGACHPKIAWQASKMAGKQNGWRATTLQNQASHRAAMSVKPAQTGLSLL